MSGTYRDELNAALSQAEALRRDNDALKRENDQLRQGPTAEPMAALPQRRRALLVAAAAMCALGVAAGFLMTARSIHTPDRGMYPHAVDQPTLATSVPSDGQIEQAFHDVAPAVQGCATGLNHAVTMAITFDSGGGVANAELVSPAELSETGRCVARAVRGARVPAFTQPTYQVRRVFIL